ncbi:MAG: hypothetical protein AAGF12_38075 [Myxococcota bacterium]
MKNALPLDVPSILPRTGLALLIGAGAFAVGCGGGQAEEGPPEYPPVDEPEPVVEATPEPEPEPEPPPPPPIEVVAGERSAIEGSAPTLRIRSPRMNQMIRRGDVMLNAQLRGWELAPAPGQHVHIIVDNEPYIAVRDVSSPVNLNEIYRNTFERDLAEGTHVVRMFPSRGHHESVKEGTPFAMVMFHYRSRTEDFEFDASAPLLTYSRPKGCATAGERLLLDFYIANVEDFGEGTRVHYRVGDVEGDITSWVPHYIQNLQVGEVPIQLTLMNAEGPIAGPFNDTSRTIQVQESCE